MASVESQFAFIKHDAVGSAAAEDDALFLNESFIDTGELRILLDCSDPKRIIVGRTGTGKSALIYRLSQAHNHVGRLSPHDLSLNFIATNKVITFFEEAGVNLSPFYVLLWKHLLVVELLKKKFNIVNQDSQTDYLRNIKSLLFKKDNFKEMAYDYLEQWGNKFWLTSEQRVHELTSKVEDQLKGSLSGKLPGVTFGAEGAKKLSTEEKRQITEHGLDAVSKIQVRELGNIMQVLNEHVFEDPGDRYYITVDMLDEDWADDRIKFRLIRALIDCVRQFRTIQNVKIILALRQDLLQKVIFLESAPGFQEEKYKSLYINLQWHRKDLERLVEKRLNQLIRRRYTKEDITCRDVFTSKVDGVPALDYMLERTFYRPRDIILFVNECIALCEGRVQIPAAAIKEAEGRYSRERLQSIGHEWGLVLPNLISTARVFEGMKDHFPINELTEEILCDSCVKILPDIPSVDDDPIAKALNSLTQENTNFQSVRGYIIREFYKVGILGIKIGPNDRGCPDFCVNGFRQC